MGVSKVVLDGVTQIDLTQDTVTKHNLYANSSAINAAGDKIMGSAQADNEDALLEKTISGTYVNSDITAVRSYAFARQYGLTKVDLPNVTSISFAAFYSCTGLEEVNLPSLTALASTAVFSGDTALTSVNLGSVTTIPDYTFANCTSLQSFNGEQVILADTSCFYGCSSLVSVNMPKVTTIGARAFYNCTSLASFDGPEVTTIKTYANTTGGHFQNCASLSIINLPKLGYSTNVPEAFRNCTSLKKVFFPKMTALYSASAFAGCASLVDAIFPRLSGSNHNYDIYTNYFSGDISLKHCDVLNPYYIYNGAFNGCNVFNTLIIRGTSRTTALNNINAFTGTAFASDGAGGILYVPETKIAAYESATNWSTILGYENNQIKSIESTHEDPDAPIDLTLYYMDGTPIA